MSMNQRKQQRLKHHKGVNHEKQHQPVNIMVEQTNDLQHKIESYTS
uniref:Uncharacterized protein n=1 Tax=Arundo donax TaxID=35708 RepID=A0A0A9HIH8_ARUDO